MYEKCELCPRRCGVNRSEKRGFCGCSDTLRISKAMPHFGEEPVISGKSGSGAVFFSGCVLRCPFCQNFPISHELKGKDVTEQEFEEILLNLQEQGVHNINLVTPTQWLESILPVLKRVKSKLKIPVVYNTGGYELTEQIRRLEGLVDIYLPDLKYYSSELSARYGAARDYFDRAFEAIKEMLRQQPENVIENGIMKKGVIIRHLVLPSHYKDSMMIFSRLSAKFSGKLPMISVMRQYVPCYNAAKFPEINRRLTTYEYQKVADLCAELGFEGFLQQKGCDNLDMTPVF